MARARTATKSLRSAEHRALCRLLVAERQKTGLTQMDVAARLGKPQSYVAKYEGGERRLDVIEFLQVACVLGKDPASLIRGLSRKR
jgi:transcriptional regulator with XRE-family HTH domain